MNTMIKNTWSVPQIKNTNFKETHLLSQVIGVKKENKNEINLEDDYAKNHINSQKSSTVDEDPVFKAEENRRTSMKISKVSLSDTQTEEDGDSILKLLLSETKQDQK